MQDDRIQLERLQVKEKELMRPRVSTLDKKTYRRIYSDLMFIRFQIRLLKSKLGIK